MYKVIHKNYAHHHPATPVMAAGKWKVYNTEDVEKGWPGNGICLTLDVLPAHVERLKALGDTDLDAKWDLPVVEAEPQQEAESQMEAAHLPEEQSLT